MPRGKDTKPRHRRTKAEIAAGVPKGAKRATTPTKSTKTTKGTKTPKSPTGKTQSPRGAGLPRRGAKRVTKTHIDCTGSTIVQAVTSLIGAYVPPENINTLTERILDASKWPLHVGSKVRVRAPSKLFPGKEITFIGKVTGIIRETMGLYKGRVLCLINDGTEGRVAIPATCWAR